MIDIKSVEGMVATITIGIISDISKSSVMFYLGLAVGISTLAYNIIRIRKEVKK